MQARTLASYMIDKQQLGQTTMVVAKKQNIKDIREEIKRLKEIDACQMTRAMSRPTMPLDEI